MCVTANGCIHKICLQCQKEPSSKDEVVGQNGAKELRGNVRLEVLSSERKYVSEVTSKETSLFMHREL